MSKWRKLLAAIGILMMFGGTVLAPTLAEARAGGSYSSGGGSSFLSQGSRGSRTYNSDGGAPLQRSLTQRSSPYGSPYGNQPGYAQSHPFLTGLAGGIFGSWLGSLFFPHWGGMGYGYGYSGIGGALFSWLLILGVIWMVIRLVRGGFAPRTYSSSGIVPMASYQDTAMGYYGGASAGAIAAPLAINEADYGAFETILKGTQSAWTAGNLSALRQFVTPEMLSYFSEQLAENQSQGVINTVENVELLRGDLREAWDEGHLHYATAYLQWRALDYTVRADRTDVVVNGNPTRPSDVAELWTFARSPGGHWLLSAIQQV